MRPLILGLGIILKIEPYLVKIARYIVITLDVGLSTNDNIHKVRQYVSVIAYQHNYTVIFFFAYPGWNFRNLALLVQSLTIAIVFELIYYTNGHFQGMTDIHEYIQNAMSTYYINQFFMAYIS